MCNYTHVAYSCGHCRYTVRAWCEDYEKTHKRCPLHVVAIEKRINERCGDCLPVNSAPWMAHLRLPASRMNSMSHSISRSPSSQWGCV